MKWLYASVYIVSGLSFQGSSGSPVFLHLSGIKIQSSNGISVTGATDTLRVQKIIGIMSGHWREQSDTPSMFKHSGLSYYTRSTAILDLLKQASVLT